MRVISAKAITDAIEKACEMESWFEVMAGCF
ncbi:hypothetical protein PCC21_003710 [Pectobacterium carotovorum subsp. carotovorum PCC21]|nr:hypothetical protein PCC21_003710 [Pectobacterium carotovorum subsp. carotovorum PCC21]